MKKIVVTGVSRGLGLALSKALLEAGYGVIGLGRGDSPAFTALEAAHPGQTAYVQADMTELQALSDIARHISKAYGPIYGLVNNAGIGAARSMVVCWRRAAMCMWPAASSPRPVCRPRVPFRPALPRTALCMPAR